MYKNKYMKYLKKNIFGGVLSKCNENHLNDFKKIDTIGKQNCGIYIKDNIKDNILVKCESKIEGKCISKENFEEIMSKLVEIKKINQVGLLPIIYDYCIKTIEEKEEGDCDTIYYTTMEKIDGDITDFLFEYLPNLIINKKYSKYQNDFNIIIKKINELAELNLKTPQEQKTELNTPETPTPTRTNAYSNSPPISPIKPPLFDFDGGSEIPEKFEEFIGEYKKQYDIHLEKINDKVKNIITILYQNNLIDDDGHIPQNYGYKIIDENIENDFKYGYSISGELNLNVLLYKIDFMSLKIIEKIPDENFSNFKFNLLDNNEKNFFNNYVKLSDENKNNIFNKL